MSNASSREANPSALMRSWRTLIWRIQKIKIYIINAVCRRLYQDEESDNIATVLIAGTARSGTTWLGELIASPFPTRIMFEPFRASVAKQYCRFPEFPYMRPEDENKELSAYCRRVFTGHVRHPWIDRQVNCLRPRLRLIKEVRVNFLLKWLTNQYPELNLIMILRHPCAVVQSRMEVGWPADNDLHSFLSQDKLVEDFLKKRMLTITNARTPEEKHAIVWCISYLVPLQQFGEGSLPAVFYEDLLVHPETEIPRAFSVAGMTPPPSAFKAASQPSRTAKSFSAVVTGDDQLSRWQRQLSPGQIERIQAIVRDFGLDGIYGDSTTPLPAARRLLLPIVTE
jgi:hypothetical protein